MLYSLSSPSTTFHQASQFISSLSGGEINRRAPFCDSCRNLCSSNQSHN